MYIALILAVVLVILLGNTLRIVLYARSGQYELDNRIDAVTK
jgi:hypothetical protein